MKPKFLIVFCVRVKTTYAINIDSILSIHKTNWDGSKSNIEFKGNQGYNNHSVFITETLEEILEKINNL